MLEDLQRWAGKPATHVDEDLDKWRELARSQGKRYADYGTQVWIPGVARVIQPWAGAPYSPGQLARAYLKMQCWPWSLHRWEDWGLDPTPAIIFRGEAEAAWHYVDLSHAYWQIGSRLPWWVSKPGQTIEKRGIWRRADEFGSLRECRLALFGQLTWPQPSTSWVDPDGEIKVSTVPAQKARYGNRAWGTATLMVVHAIAAEIMERFPEAALWHTDGVLVPAERSEEVIAWLAKRWRIEARVKETGEGRVLGPGVYEWRETFREVRPTPMRLVWDQDLKAIRRWWLAYAPLP